jgi:hypothetical protein
MKHPGTNKLCSLHLKRFLFVPSFTLSLAGFLPPKIKNPSKSHVIGGRCWLEDGGKAGKAGGRTGDAGGGAGQGGAVRERGRSAGSCDRMAQREKGEGDLGRA